MTTEKLFDEGRYMVIYLYPEVNKPFESNKVVHKSMRLQSVKLDERMFFLWTKEDLADTKKLGNSCEDMEAYQERLRVRKRSTGPIFLTLAFTFSHRRGSL